ncbi:phosphotransferase family protein [Bacillus sp. EB600]|uniref:phosphotransferase family protein n=1 Tax=Bacillus sp. EB600 TaxID=2806345 RepID=UPI00210EA139|nr:phosphotransferase family protein [Bacillus sp. EB600]MCQ6279523.1 phosphotransferase family protein [Bacillus sp. EB600]
MLKQNINVLNRSQNDINWIAFEKFVRSHIENLDPSPLKVKQFTEGYSNLTYLIKIGNWEAIMRRPPFGKLPPKAHDVEREFILLEKLHSVFPLAPQPYLYEEDPNIMDKHFYIMEKKNGIVLDDRIPPLYQEVPNIEKILSESVVDTLVQLHDIDYKQAGLADFGKPDGYLERQVHGWMKRYKNSKTDEIEVYPDIEKWITSNIPDSPSPTIVHNDYKVNNMMFSVIDPGKPVGVLDWEMCTIGDPLTDLASAIAYWKDENDPFTAINSVTTNGGFISRQAFLERYASKSNRDLSNFQFYLAFAYFKIAAILQQIYYRWKEGHIVDDRFSSLIEGIQNLMQLSHDVIYSKKG